MYKRQVLRNPTAAFDTLRAENPALYVSLRDQFIPAMEYTCLLYTSGERTRISTLLRNVGCYYFRPDYLTYQADTMMVPNGMSRCA